MISFIKKVLCVVSSSIFLTFYTGHASDSSAEATEFSDVLILQELDKLKIKIDPGATQSYMPFLTLLIFIFLPACTPEKTKKAPLS